VDDHVRSFRLTRLVFAEVPANAVYTSPYPLLQVRRDIPVIETFHRIRGLLRGDKHRRE